MYTLKFSFCIIFANFLADNKASASFFPPVIIIFPVRNIRAVVRGSKSLITHPLNLAGLYSEFLVRKLITLRSNGQPTSIVATQLLKVIHMFEFISSIIGIKFTV